MNFLAFFMILAMWLSPKWVVILPDPYYQQLAQEKKTSWWFQPNPFEKYAHQIGSWNPKVWGEDSKNT